MESFGKNLAEQARSNELFYEDVLEGRLNDPSHFGLNYEQDVFVPMLDCKRSACFIAPHWGNFISSFVDCAFALPEGTEFITFRGEKWRDDEDLFWDKLNQIGERKVRVQRVLENRFLVDVCRALRSGAHLFVLFDLFEQYGTTDTVQLFSHKLQMTSGWTRLAYISKTPVVFMKPKSVERSEAEIYGVLDPYAYTQVHDFTEACLLRCGKLLESLLLEKRDYWFMWNRWPDYKPIKFEDHPAANFNLEGAFATS